MSDLENTLQEVLNFNLPVFQIDEDGDLKFLFYYQTEVMPAINDTIVNMLQDDDGKFVRRIYYKVADILFPVTPSGKNTVVAIQENPVVHVVLQVDEPITDGV